jgi:hypothetical protein
MKKVGLILLLTSTLFAGPGYTPAVARFCVNRVVPRMEVKMARIQARMEGCNEVTVMQVDASNYLVYGVKVLVGESVP